MSLWGDLVKAKEGNREKRGETGENEMISEAGSEIYRGGNRYIDKPENLRQLHEALPKNCGSNGGSVRLFFIRGHPG
jgi:hypothetical protein